MRKMLFFIALSLVFAPYTYQIFAQKVEKIIVFSSQNPNIIVESSKRIIPEEETITRERIQLLREELLATGLIKSVRIELRRSPKAGFVIVHIFPAWTKEFNKARITKVTFEGFSAKVNNDIDSYLSKNKSLLIPIVDLTLGEIKIQLSKAVNDLYENSPELLEIAEREILGLSYKIVNISPGSVQLVILAT